VLKPWDQRNKATHTDILTIAEHLEAALDAAPDGRLFVVAPPPIQGIGNAGGLQMRFKASNSYHY
jgi:HAE1 family hydrophobic/amphiphilic exporter-1